MSSLREIKDRIASVKGTIKVASAMKLIASSKLHRAQQSAEALRRYSDALGGIIATLPASAFSSLSTPSVPDAPPAIVALSSNNSLCGAFNANVIRQALREAAAYPEAEVFALGRKMADAMRREGRGNGEDFSALVTPNGQEAAAALANRLMKACEEGRYSRVILVYTHFASAARQEVVVRDLLPFSCECGGEEDDMEKRVIYEPSPAQIAHSLLPALIRLEMRSVCIDSFAAECAARTIAMQVASDNAQSLMGDLTLEYNKRRQDKITSEILDLVGGSLQE